jgi:hypothetical protein
MIQSCGGAGSSAVHRTRKRAEQAGATTPARSRYRVVARASGPKWHLARRTSSALSAVAQKAHVHNLHTTILHGLGLNHERLTIRYAGRDFRLIDVSGRVVRVAIT